MIKEVEDFINELHTNEHISVLSDGILENRRLLKYRDAKENFEEVYSETKISVPKEDWKYEDLGSLHLDWESGTIEPEEFYLFGGFKLHHFSSALTDPSDFWRAYNGDNRFWENNSQPEAEAIWKDFLPKVNYFEKSGHGDYGTYGCILRDEGVYPCPVYFFDSGIWFELPMSLSAYYDAMIACKAVHYWQYFYIDTEEIVEKLGNFRPVFIEHGAKFIKGPHTFGDKFKDGTFTTSAEGVLQQMKNIIKRYPKLFPDVDLGYFKERYSALEKALNP